MSLLIPVRIYLNFYLKGKKSVNLFYEMHRSILTHLDSPGRRLYCVCGSLF